LVFSLFKFSPTSSLYCSIGADSLQFLRHGQGAICDAWIRYQRLGWIHIDLHLHHAGAALAVLWRLEGWEQPLHEGTFFWLGSLPTEHVYLFVLKLVGDAAHPTDVVVGKTDLAGDYKATVLGRDVANHLDGLDCCSCHSRSDF